MDYTAFNRKELGLKWHRQRSIIAARHLRNLVALCAGRAAPPTLCPRRRRRFFPLGAPPPTIRRRAADALSGIFSLPLK